MSLDRDLRDALQPMAGDPVADAMAVLGKLPPLPPPPPPASPDGPVSPKVPRSRERRPRAPSGEGVPRPYWWWLVGAVALGLACGIALTVILGGGAAPTPSGPPSGPPKGEVPTPVAPDVKKPQPMPDEQLDLMLMAFGDLSVDEPGKGRQALKAGPYTVLPGTLFETGESLAGIYVYQNDLRVRLDRATAAVVEPELVTLVRGRMWWSNHARPAAIAVRTDFGDIQGDAASVVLERREVSLWVACLEGELTVVPGAGSRLRLDAGQQVELRRGGPVTEVQQIPFAGSVTSWMTRMILLQQDDTELRYRIAEMRDAFLAGTHRDAAEQELRRLGSVIVPALFALCDPLGADPELRRRTMALLADVADYSSIDRLLTLLEDGDAETRVHMFRALRRITGEAVGDEVVWREGSPEVRAAAVRDWRARLR